MQNSGEWMRGIMGVADATANPTDPEWNHPELPQLPSLAENLMDARTSPVTIFGYFFMYLGYFFMYLGSGYFFMYLGYVWHMLGIGFLRMFLLV